MDEKKLRDKMLIFLFFYRTTPAMHADKIVLKAPAMIADTETRAMSPAREGAILPNNEIWDPSDEGLANEQHAKVASN